MVAGNANAHRFRRWISWLPLAIGVGLMLSSVGPEAERLKNVVSRFSEWGAAEIALTLLAFLLYGFSHVLRAIRLYLILGIQSVKFSAVLGCHSSTAFMSLFVPYKLGEVVRLHELATLHGNYVKAVLSVWIDRVFDAVFVLIAFGLICLFRGGSWATDQLLLLTLLFLCVPLVLIFFLPGALRALETALVGSRSRRSLWLLKIVSGVHGILERRPMLNAGLIGLASLITIGVWILELATVGSIVMLEGRSFIEVLDQLSFNLVGGPTSAQVTESYQLYRVVAVSALVTLSALYFRKWLRRRGSAQSLVRRPGYWATPWFTTQPFDVKGRDR